MHSAHDLTALLRQAANWLPQLARQSVLVIDALPAVVYDALYCSHLDVRALGTFGTLVGPLLLDAVTFSASPAIELTHVTRTVRVESSGGRTGAHATGTPGASHVRRPPPADPSPGLLPALAAFLLVEYSGSAPLCLHVYVCVSVRVCGTAGTRVCAAGTPRGCCSNRSGKQASHVHHTTYTTATEVAAWDGVGFYDDMDYSQPIGDPAHAASWGLRSTPRVVTLARAHPCAAHVAWHTSRQSTSHYTRSVHLAPRGTHSLHRLHH